MRLADFSEYGLQQLAVGLSQTLAEKPRGNANDQAIILGRFLASGTKPCGETMRIDAPLTAKAILVEPDRLLIGTESWGIFDFAMPAKASANSSPR